MSEQKREKRRVELRIVDAPPDPDPDDRGGGGGSGDGGGSDPPRRRPAVDIAAGWRTQAIDEAEKHLVKGDRDLFQRGGQIVRVADEEVDTGNGRKAKTLRIIPTTVEHMRERFTRAVDLRRYDKRGAGWQSCDCPKDFAQAYLDRVGWWRVPVLRAVVTAPTLRPNGTILDKPGYDKNSRLYYHPRGVRFPPVPERPGRDAAIAALAMFKGLLATFDFVDPASHSVALSWILTVLTRPAMTAAPLHAFTAPVAGSGKSKIVNIAAVLRTGHPAPVTALGQREEETEKRLGAAMIGGDPIIALDNIERPLGGELIDQLVTEPLVNARVLGLSVNRMVPNVYCLSATGNNLRTVGDMVRRTLLSRLDPGCERPELREFETPDPVVTATAERPLLVAAALTIVRAFFLAGCPNDVPALGSFPEWSRWVRDVLIWLDEADPVASMDQVRKEDPRIGALTAVLYQWDAVFGTRSVSVREVVDTANQVSVIGGHAHADLREALLTVAGDGRGIATQRLGHWLARNKGRSLAGLRLEPATMSSGIARWQIVKG